MARTKDLGQLELFTDMEAARKAVNNWRSVHSYPLQLLKMTLRQRALSVDKSAVVYQWLKRLEAIKAKMHRQFEEHGRMFGLTFMQDMGGCRALRAMQKRLKSRLRLTRKHTEKIRNAALLNQSADNGPARTRRQPY